MPKVGDKHFSYDEAGILKAEQEAAKTGFPLEYEDRNYTQYKHGGPVGKTGKDWISRAIENPGAFSAKAKDAGTTTSKYANEVTAPGSRASAKTKKQANLAKTLMKMNKKA